MKLHLRYRHPLRWRKCVRQAERNKIANEWVREHYPNVGELVFTPGQIYTLHYVVKRRRKP